MKQPAFVRLNKRFTAAVVCIVCAAVLLGAALLEPKTKATNEWVPLNEAVEDALALLEEQSPEQEAPDPASAADDEHSDHPAASPPGAEVAVNAAASDSAASAGQADTDGRVDINSATAEELDALKGIGPTKAQAIVADREQNGKFKNERDLLRVKGIGEKLLSGIQDSIVARP